MSGAKCRCLLPIMRVTFPRQQFPWPPRGIVSLSVAPMNSSRRTMRSAGMLLLACLIPPLECIVDDLLQRYCSSLGPGADKGLLPQLGACLLDCLLIESGG